MRQFWKKRLPAVLMALTLMVGMVPFAGAVEPDPADEGVPVPQAAPHQHRFEGQTYEKSDDPEQHYQKCAEPGCEATLNSPHRFTGSWTQDKAPSCTQEGHQYRLCTDCGYKQEQNLSMLAHTYSSGWVYENESVHARTCDVCQQKETQAHTHAGGDSGAITLQPTCTAAGRRSYTCTVCRSSYFESIPALGHTDSNSDGYCDRCSAVTGARLTVTFRTLSGSTTQSVPANNYPANPANPGVYTVGGVTYTFRGWTTDYTGSSWYVYDRQNLVTPSSVRITAATTFYAVYDASAAITVNAAPGERKALDAEAFNDAYQQEYGSGQDIIWVEFTVSSSDYSAFPGALYAGNTMLSRSDVNGSKFYYEDPKEGDYDLDDLYLVPNDGARDGQLELAFTAYRSNSRYVEGTLKLSISRNTVSTGDITYKVAPGGTVRMDEDDFDQFFRKTYSGYTMDYVVFDRPDTSAFNNGSLYYDYNGPNQIALTRTSLSGYDFYYNASSRDYDLDLLTFVAGRDFKDGVTLSFTIYGTGSRRVTGTVTIVSGENDGDTITYKVRPGATVALDEDDFDRFFRAEYPGYTLSYVVFDRPATTAFDNGALYYDYGSRNQLALTRTSLSGYDFYYNASSRDYDLDLLTFVAGQNFKDETELTFTAYGLGTRRVTGAVKIVSTEKPDSTAISYTVAPGGSVAFKTADFQTAYRSQYSTGSVRYVTFTAPAAYASAGTLYANYGAQNQQSFTQSTLAAASSTFYYSAAADGTYDLSRLTFLASQTFRDTLTLSFRAYGDNGRYVDGTVAIKSDGPAAVTASSAGDIRYYAVYGDNVQINANDIARYFSRLNPGSTLQYVTLGGIPAVGGLYYNYYNASRYGSATRLQLSAANYNSLALYFSPTAATQYALTELTYVPSGYNYVTTIPFTAYGTGSQTASGSILISVNPKAVPDVYGVTPRNSSVTLPLSNIASVVATATGVTPASIQFVSLPLMSTGSLYVGTGTDRAVTTAAYPVSGQSIRFVPTATFTGSVELPYVAYNASGAAFAAGKFCLGVVNQNRSFTDMTASTWCYKYVVELSDADVIDGYADGSFKPNNPITYGAALKLIMLAAGYPEQAPTTAGSPFSGYLALARSEGIITRSNVNLSAPITRLQVAQLAAGAMKLNTSNLSSIQPFTDTTDESVRALNAAGIVEGYFSNGTSTYRPNNQLTRGQVSAIVWRMENYNK